MPATKAKVAEATTKEPVTITMLPPDPSKGAIDPADTILAGRIRDTVTLEVSGYHLMQAIEQRIDGDFEPAKVMLSPVEQRVLAATGIYDPEHHSLHDLCTKLAIVRGVREQMSEFSFDQLEQAQANLKASRERLRTEKAAIGDLEEIGESTEPTLAAQIRRLQEKLHNLEKEAIAAENKVLTLEDRLRWLESHAPACLITIVDSRRMELKRSPEARSLEEVNSQVSQLDELLRESLPNGKWDVGNRSFKGMWFAYCEHNFPAGATEKRGTRSLDVGAINKHLDKRRQNELPNLRKRQAELQAAYDERAAQIRCDEPIRRWIESGGNLTMDDLMN